MKTLFSHRHAVENDISAFKTILETAGNSVLIPSKNQLNDFLKSWCFIIMLISNSVNSSASFDDM